MNKPGPQSSSSPESDAERARLDEALRRATPRRRVVLPSPMARLRLFGMYANVFAVVIALGIPNGVMRRTTAEAVASFDGIARQAAGSLIPVGVNLEGWSAPVGAGSDAPEPDNPEATTVEPISGERPNPEPMPEEGDPDAVMGPDRYSTVG